MSNRYRQLSTLFLKAVKMLQAKLQRLPKHHRVLSLWTSLVIVASWTILRHITNSTDFDKIGQVGLAEQWSNGDLAGAEVGPTNYLLKIPVYWLINQFEFLSGHTQLLLVALILNFATFILLFLIVEKLLQLYAVKDRSWFYLGFIWLASISGSVFWIDYANSRNIEIAGGIFLAYLSLDYLKNHQKSTLLWLVGIGSIVFFADPLQAFVVGVPISVLIIGRWLIGPTVNKLWEAAWLCGATVIAFILSKGLFASVGWLLPISFLAVPASVPELTITNLWLSLQASLSNTLKIFDAEFLKSPITPNSIRETINFIILCGLVALTIKLLSKHPEQYPRKAILLAITISYVAYIASGNALQWETSRYLIMVPIFCFILTAVWGQVIFGHIKNTLQTAWAIGLCISMFLLLGGLALSWPERYKKDIYISNVQVFMDQHKFTYAISSREIGIPVSYMSKGPTTVLPAICTNDHTIRASKLFYDKAAFRVLDKHRGDIPIILQDGRIGRLDPQCSKQDIIAQFGNPKLELNVPGIGLALVYDAQQIQLYE